MKHAISSALMALTLVALAGARPAAAELPLDQALDALDQRLDQTPRDAGLLTDYGNLLTRAGRFEEALDSYQAALEADPESLVALYNLGLLEYELGHRRAAGRHFQTALKIDSTFGRAHYGLGTVLAQRQRHRRAVKHFSRAFSLEPELLDANHNPELLFNHLATWASMHSYLNASPQRGTRLYNDPQPIVGLLVPELELLQSTAGQDAPAETATEQPSDQPPNDDGNR